MLDWDRVRIFHAVATAGSFTHAANGLNLSQSAISRQIGALEDDLGTPLFHRHARGLVLTEQGEILRDAAQDVAARMARTQVALSVSKQSAAGHLRINTTVGIGAIWLTSHLGEFLDRHPDITVSMLIIDGELDLSMREADVAIRLNPPTQQDLIQRRLMTVHTHLYATPTYLEDHGRPQTVDDLDDHRLIAYGIENKPPVPTLNWVLKAGHADNSPPRTAAMRINNISGMLKATESSIGIASLPDYLTKGRPNLERVLPDLEGPSFTAYFVYPEEMRRSKRIAVFREFLLDKVAAEGVW
jgi:DNA-binding transcriptional LysR family regulator